MGNACLQSLKLLDIGDMRKEFLCSTNANTLVRRCAAATDSRLVTIPFKNAGAELTADSQTAEMTAAWESFLDHHRQHTRFNSPRRFVERAASDHRDQAQSIAVLFFTDRLRAVIVGEMRPHDKWYRTGALSRLLPGLDCLAIEQSCIVTDGTDEAIAAVTSYLNDLLRQNCLQRLEMKNLDVGRNLHKGLSKELAIGAGIQRVAHHRFYRNLRDRDTGQPIDNSSAKSRRKLRLRQRALEKECDDQLEFDVVMRPDQTDAFIRDAAQIVSQTYQAALGIGLRDDPATRDYLQTLAREGTMRGFAFRSNNTAIAYAVGDLTSGTYHLWAISFLPDYAKLSPGILLLNKAFDLLTAEGVEVFDFGHGDAEYKRRLGNAEMQEEDVLIYGAGLVPRTAFLVHTGIEKARKRARDALVRSGQLDRIRKLGRRLLRRAGER
jgi:hypothetical protein